MYHVSWAPTAPVQKPSSGMSRMHRRILASLCVLIFLFLASSATGTGTPTTPDFASPLITKGPSNQYTVIHIVLPGRLRAPSPKLQGKPLKHYNPRDTGSTRKFRRQDTASQTTATPLPTPTPGQGFVAYFQDLDGAIDADGYITFSLVKTVTGTVCCLIFLENGKPRELTLEILLTRLQGLLRLCSWMPFRELYVSFVFF